MIQLSFPSTIKAQPRSVTFLIIKTVVRKIQKNDSQTGSCAWTRQCLDKGGGGVQPIGIPLGGVVARCAHGAAPF